MALRALGVCLATVLALAGPAAFAQDAATLEGARALRDQALEANIAYALTEEMTTRFGPRLAGTEAEHASAAWGAERLRALGFSNVRIQTFPLEVWDRGEERVEIVGPFAQPVTATALGGSRATPPGGIEAEIVIFETFQDLLDVPEGGLEGRIAVVLQDTPRAQTGAGYGSTSPIRFQGPIEARRRGAVAFLLRSLGTHDHRFAHTGATRVPAEMDETVPAFAISPPDADQLRRLAALDAGPIRLRLTSTARFVRSGHSQNVIAEIPGTDPDAGVIVIGGHLDSWDLGTGAVDDAAGIGITTAAAHAILESGLRPRRTIRIVWWGAEEVSQPGAPGLAGARAYADALTEAEVAAHIAISESDFGAGPVYSFSLPAGHGGDHFRREALRILSPLGIIFDPDPATGGGPDTGPTVARGVPAFRLNQDGTDYFDVHHTVDDVIDRVDPVSMTQNVAAWAALLWLIADSDVSFRAQP